MSIAHAGFWTHEVLIFLFLNLLPHSKHFHVITAIPNVFLRSLRPAGRLVPIADNAEKLMEVVGVAGESADPLAQPIGIARIQHFSWKALLDFYTCTECGRCSDNCPAHRTGKILSPKHMTLALRDHLYAREEELITEQASDTELGVSPVNLVPEVIHPDVLWACTSCRACEEQCPVLISYVDKIIDMRRSLVMVRGEFPHELAKPFQGMESNGNPWNLSRMDRAAWSDGLGVPMMKDKPTAPVLFWVGCAASYDDRAKKIARATAKLLTQAGVDFAILGQEENCTGDPARRAGNEFLFATFAEGNAAVINGYKERGRRADGRDHLPALLQHPEERISRLRAARGSRSSHRLFAGACRRRQARAPQSRRRARRVPRLLLPRPIQRSLRSPREILRRIPGVELVEAEYWTKQRGFVLRRRRRADVDGGAESGPGQRQAHAPAGRRARRRGERGSSAKHDRSACPFCMTMLTDGVKSKNLEESVRQLDVVELLERACESLGVPVGAGTLVGAGPVAPLGAAEPSAQGSASGTRPSNALPAIARRLGELCSKECRRVRSALVRWRRASKIAAFRSARRVASWSISANGSTRSTASPTPMRRSRTPRFEEKA